MLEEYSDEEIGIMVIILGTFIHREPALAAPFLPEILSTVTKFDISENNFNISSLIYSIFIDMRSIQHSHGNLQIQHIYQEAHSLLLINLSGAFCISWLQMEYSCKCF